MILTGSEIVRECSRGRITISPFSLSQVNPNSYNFRLGGRLGIYSESLLDPRRPNACEEVEIPEEGYTLEPGRLYLAHTVEVLGSRYYAPTFAARSSVARLGLFINLSACLGDIGYEGQWTLQLYTVNRLRVYRHMDIGQMMWWTPSGAIELYKGKYQGSVGPRASDIHRDFEQKFARQRFPGFSGLPDPEQVGYKFSSLARAARSFLVPTAVVVPAAEFRAAVSQEATAELQTLFEDMRATVGAFFGDSVRRIEAVAAGFRLPDSARRLLAVRLADAFSGTEPTSFAVRSSGLTEDGSASSMAGVHSTLLAVDGIDAVLDAVEQCWRSYYSAPALAARIRVGDFSSVPVLAVIVQELIEPELAGVAFSGLDGQPGQITVEYVEGLAEGLMAGTQVPYRASSDTVTEVSAAHAATVAEAIRITRRLQAEWGHDIDVEWAADGRGVHVIQVRPVTARRASYASDPAALWIRSLYFEEPPNGATLGEVAEVYAYYRAKRGPVYRLARQLGIEVGHGWLIGFAGRALADPDLRGQLASALATGSSAECVLDFGDTMRQIVVPKTEVVSRIREVTDSGPRAAGPKAVLVRDFVRGQLGVISRVSGGRLIVEYTAEGLLALNRGTTGPETLILAGAEDTEVRPGGEPLLPHLRQLAAFTQAMQDKYGDVTLEWVLSGDALLFIDYSALGSDHVLTSGSGVVISSGSATGPVLHLKRDELLSRLSIGPAVSIDKSIEVSGHSELVGLLERIRAWPEPPIIRVSRPYAALSVLIGSVAGFVFDQGSVLCHLAILLREAGVPAASATGLGEIPDGLQGVISGGAFTVASTTNTSFHTMSKDSNSDV